MKIHYLGDFPQGEVFVIVKTQDCLLNFRNTLDFFRQQPLQFRALQQGGREVVVGLSDVVQEVVSLVIAGILDTGYIEPANLD